MRLVDALSDSQIHISQFFDPGTLAIGSRGEARYFGQTARGEACSTRYV
jgi:hypothetical protein